MYIKKAILNTNQLTKMQKFYCEIMNLPLITSTTTLFEVQVGTSILSFIQSEKMEETQYHFAFNIPSNLFKKAKEWLRAKVELLEEDGADEIFFEWSNAHSVYFLDPCENVLEFIAQHDVSPSRDEEYFSSDLIVNIGEMNVTTDDVLLVGETLKQLGIPVGKHAQLDEKSLNFMGEKEDGTFLLLGPSGRTWYFSSKKAIVSPVKLELSNHLTLILDSEGHLSAIKTDEQK
ncbi:glyoxalase [Lysinibacillus sp. NPDC097287]|uniref:glyoxalase n=1 Tax=Lysinibacillus sp. NPDC097287 TaxID=3364144 RepID=UPI0037FFB063